MVYANSLQEQARRGRLDFSPRSPYYAAFSAIPALNVMTMLSLQQDARPFSSGSKHQDFLQDARVRWFSEWSIVTF